MENLMLENIWSTISNSSFLEMIKDYFSYIETKKLWIEE